MRMCGGELCSPWRERRTVTGSGLDNDWFRTMIGSVNDRFVEENPQSPRTYMSRDKQSNQKQSMTFGLIVGNRGFFPDHLAKAGREDMLRAFDQAGIDA